MELDDGFSINQVLDAHWGVLNEEDVRSLTTYVCNMFTIKRLDSFIFCSIATEYL